MKDKLTLSEQNRTMGCILTNWEERDTTRTMLSVKFPLTMVFQFFRIKPGLPLGG